MSDTQKVLASVMIAGALVFLSLFLISQKPQLVQGSVIQGSEYLATTTGAGGGFNTAVARVGFDPDNLNAGISGSLSSIYFSTPTIGIIDVYDATTTNINLRTGAIATSSIFLTSFPAGTGTSTVTLDIRYVKGLIFVFRGSVSSTTISYR